MRLAETRASIEPVLRGHSSRKNVKVNELTRRMVERATEQPRSEKLTGYAAVLGFMDGVQDFSRREAG